MGHYIKVQCNVFKLRKLFVKWTAIPLNNVVSLVKWTTIPLDNVVSLVKHTLAISIIKRSTKFLKPGKNGSITGLQNAECSQSYNWVLRKCTKCRNSAQLGSRMPQ